MQMLDRVRCLNAEGNCLLRSGALYTVSGVAPNYFESGDGLYLLEVEQRGSSHGFTPFYAWRFRPTHAPVEQSQRTTFVSKLEPV